MGVPWPPGTTMTGVLHASNRMSHLREPAMEGWVGKLLDDAVYGVLVIGVAGQPDVRRAGETDPSSEKPSTRWPPTLIGQRHGRLGQQTSVFHIGEIEPALELDCRGSRWALREARQGLPCLPWCSRPQEVQGGVWDPVA